MNYVDLSGIYPIQIIAYVFLVMLVNPPSIWILDSNWRSSMNFIAFREVEGWHWVRKSFWCFFVDSDLGILSCH